ncbi:MAG: hypothetical protein K6E38_02520 [Fretibacterium sp.]|nr:hypothetical protein [Fretibacterium sp.]
MENGLPRNIDGSSHGGFRFEKAEQDGMTLYIRSDMHFTGGCPEIVRVDYRGSAWLMVKNMQL